MYIDRPITTRSPRTKPNKQVHIIDSHSALAHGDFRIPKQRPDKTQTEATNSRNQLHVYLPPCEREVRVELSLEKHTSPDITRRPVVDDTGSQIVRTCALLFVLHAVMCLTTHKRTSLSTCPVYLSLHAMLHRSDPSPQGLIEIAAGASWRLQ